MCRQRRILVIETMNRVILGYCVKIRVKSDSLVIELLPAPEAEEVVKYALDEIVNLYDVLPLLSYKDDDSIKIIYDLNRSNIPMLQLVN